MLRRIASLIFLLFSSTIFAASTMRMDYYHSGNADHEIFSLDQFVKEPLPWPGNPDKPIDDTNRGKYFFEVIDRTTNKILYSRGFSSIYGEWGSTDEAKTMNRSFQESVRFPAPDRPAQIVLKKRDDQNAFQQIWSVFFDPKDIFIDTAKPAIDIPLLTLQKKGDPANKVDFLIIGDGYTAAEKGKFEKDARRLMQILFAHSPFKERQQDFNVWGLCPLSAESGISRPSTGIHKHSPVGATYDAFGSERYVLTFNNHAFREIASLAPYDVVEILTNSRTYGGGGIFNLYATVAADSIWSPYVFVHEFGHHIADLADEYYTSDVAYLPPTKKVEPWEPNATALLDQNDFKWKDLVEKGTPIPTPWNKEAFETYSRQIQQKRREIRAKNRPEEEMDALFKEEKKHEMQMLSSEKYAGKVGAFEGAIYQAKGYYRPQVDCIMFTRDDVPFCSVCQRAISAIIDLYSR